jgi:hypothetical protein
MRLLLQRHPRTGGFASPSFDGYALTRRCHCAGGGADQILDRPSWIADRCWQSGGGELAAFGKSTQSDRGHRNPLSRCAHEKTETSEHAARLRHHRSRRKLCLFTSHSTVRFIDYVISAVPPSAASSARRARQGTECGSPSVIEQLAMRD